MPRLLVLVPLQRLALRQIQRFRIQIRIDCQSIGQSATRQRHRPIAQSIALQTPHGRVIVYVTVDATTLERCLSQIDGGRQLFTTRNTVATL